MLVICVQSLATKAVVLCARGKASILKYLVLKLRERRVRSHGLQTRGCDHKGTRRAQINRAVPRASLTMSPASPNLICREETRQVLRRGHRGVYISKARHAKNCSGPLPGNPRIALHSPRQWSSSRPASVAASISCRAFCTSRVNTKSRKRP